MLEKNQNIVELNPNCSEATMRIRVDNLSKKELEELENLIKELEEDGETNNDSIWYDTDWGGELIFGIRCIIIKGETPYNNWDELVDYLSKLPFWGKVEVEEG